MPRLHVEFAVSQNVKIKPLDLCPGRIISLFIGVRGTEYFVRYFSNGKAEEVYFIASELEAA